jgi:hypothetical protein
LAPGACSARGPIAGLRKLSEETGGGYFELKKTAELAPTFTRVAAELHSLYTLGFTPTVYDNKEHKLEVKVKQVGQNARARKGYVASREGLGGSKSHSAVSASFRAVPARHTYPIHLTLLAHTIATGPVAGTSQSEDDRRWNTQPSRPSPDR